MYTVLQIHHTESILVQDTLYRVYIVFRTALNEENYSSIWNYKSDVFLTQF